MGSFSFRRAPRLRLAYFRTNERSSLIAPEDDRRGRHRLSGAGSSVVAMSHSPEVHRPGASVSEGAFDGRRRVHRGTTTLPSGVRRGGGPGPERLWPSHIWPDPRPQRGLAVARRDPGAGIPSVRGTKPAPRGGEETLSRGGGEAAEVSARPLG